MSEFFNLRHACHTLSGCKFSVLLINMDTLYDKNTNIYISFYTVYAQFYMSQSHMIKRVNDVFPIIIENYIYHYNAMFVQPHLCYTDDYINSIIRQYIRL